jgi:threonylcarbamoyladenosine tRNA methylthiotransferase MtaB
MTTIARGTARSETIDDVVAQVRGASAGGAQEVVLTGVQLTAYGRDLVGEINLAVLVKTILNETDIPRLRLSSLEPWGLPNDLLDLWRDPRMCRQLHLPLQSGSNRTLRRMARPIRTEAFARLVAEAREKIPGLALTTDIIVGFPGETEADFSESKAFVKTMEFAKAHVFVYSPRPGTPAERLLDRVPQHIANKRSQTIREIVNRSDQSFRNRFIDKKMSVLWESQLGDSNYAYDLIGLTDNYIRVFAHSDQNVWNQITSVHLRALEGEGMRGELIG